MSRSVGMKWVILSVLIMGSSLINANDVERAENKLNNNDRFISRSKAILQASAACYLGYFAVAPFTSLLSWGVPMARRFGAGIFWDKATAKAVIISGSMLYTAYRLGRRAKRNFELASQ